MILCVFGILMVVQMAIVLGRFSAQIALWEWQLRGIERQTSWTQQHLFIRLQEYRDHHQSLEDHQNDPPVLRPTWALRQHRQWWARREYSLPVFFGLVARGTAGCRFSTCPCYATSAQRQTVERRNSLERH